MQFALYFQDKTIKSKAKTDALAKGLLKGDFSLTDLLDFASTAKEPEKATCLEAIEYATKENPAIGSEKLLAFATASLNAKAPRIKWESAKVIGNIAHLYPKKLNQAIAGLLINTEDKGTVVRWAAAYALSEILKLKGSNNKSLLPAIEAIVQREENNGVKKHYLLAIKKLERG